MNHFKIIIFIMVICLLTAGISLIVGAEEAEWNPQLTLNGKIESDSLGFTGQAGILYPFNQTKNSFFYTDIRSMFNTEGDASEANLGLGYRKLLGNNNWIIGGYSFRDRRHEFGAVWDQWTLGAELMSDNFDFRINGYFPMKEKVLKDSQPADEILVIGNNVVYEEGQLNTYYETMNGYDLEIGKNFKEELPVDLGIYLRSFKFSGDNTEDLEGTGVRINTTFDTLHDTKTKVGIDWQKDNIRGSSTEVTLGVSIPLGNVKTKKEDKTEGNLVRKMTKPARRDIDVVVSETEPEREVKETDPDSDENKAVDPSGNQIEQAWYVTAEGNGNGTKNDPTNLEELTNDSGEIDAGQNDIIVVRGDNGPIDAGEYSGEDFLRLLSGQKLVSPGGNVMLYKKGGNSERPPAYFKPQGDRAKLVNDLENNIVELNDNTTVSGIEFDVKDGGIIANAIYGESISGYSRITHNTIHNASNNGISILSPSLETAVFQENIIKTVGRTGINLVNSAFFTGSISPAVSLPETNPVSVTVTGNNIGSADAVRKGINIEVNSMADSTVNISDNTVKNATYNGIILETRAGLMVRRRDLIGEETEFLNTTSVTGNNIGNIGREGGGIGISTYSSGNNNLTVSNNKVEEAGLGGITIYNETAGNNSLTVRENIINSINTNLDEVYYTRVERRYYMGTGIMIYADTGKDNQIQIGKNTVGTALNGIIVEAAADENNNILFSKNIINSATISDGPLPPPPPPPGDLSITQYEMPPFGIGIGVSSKAGLNNTVNRKDNNVESAEIMGIGAVIHSDIINPQTTSEATNNLIISGNTVGEAGFAGISGMLATEETNNITVSSNTVTAGDYGGIYLITETNNTAEALFEGNTIENESGIDRKGISLKATALGSSINAEVNNNVFADGIDPAILSTGNVTVTGNQDFLAEEINE